MTMIEAITSMCGDDKVLCEAILDLYKKVPDRTTYASVGGRLWRCIQTMHDSNALGSIIAQKGRMVPKGTTMLVAGAIFRIYAGNGSSSQIVTFNQSVGESLPDRVSINIGPWVSEYYSTHEVNYSISYNDVAYEILYTHKNELVNMVDSVLTREASNKDFVDDSISKVKEMYTTEA